MSHKGYKGFTIVELLIVIVVIAILAAISVVALIGVQNRTYDSVVKTDIRNFAGMVAEYHALHGEYPQGRGVNGPGVSGQNLNFAISRESFAVDRHNFVYCTNEDKNDFIVAAATRSSKRFGYSPKKGLHDYPYSWGGVVDVCTNEGYISGYSFSYGYNNSSKTWFSWTEGHN